MRKLSVDKRVKRIDERLDRLEAHIDRVDAMLGDKWWCVECEGQYAFALEEPAGQKLHTIKLGHKIDRWPPHAVMVAPNKDGDTMLAQYVCRSCSEACFGWGAYEARRP